MLVTVPYEIKPKKIAAFMTNAIEANNMSTSWCNGVYLKGDWEKRWKEEGRTGWWYATEDVFAGKFEIEIQEIIDESEEPEGDNIRKHICTEETFAKGFELMAQKSPSHFQDFISENDDAITADVFLQYVALGEIVYG